MKSAKSIVEKLTKLYGKIPGVIKIQNDGLSDESVIIFFDRNKLKTVLPSEYEGIKISMYDVRYVFVMSYRMVELMNDKLDLSTEENKKYFFSFYRGMELCRELLSSKE